MEIKLNNNDNMQFLVLTVENGCVMEKKKKNPLKLNMEI